MAERYQVVIVGGGPVGVGLAVELGQRGISTALVERHLEPQRIPKGQGLTSRTLEHFYYWGCAEELRAARLLPRGYPIASLTAYGNLMSDYWFVAQQPIGRGGGRSFYFQANERLPQYLTERVLRNRLAELPNVTPLFGRSAKRVQYGDNGVLVTVADEGWPYEEETLEADYLVGCDGARSLVRETVGIDRIGDDYDQRMVLAVFRSRELHEGLKRFPACTTYRVLKPELQGYWQFFGRVDVGESWFFHAPVPRDTRPDNYDFLGLIRQAAGFETNAEFDHVGFWDLRIQVASRYREDRVFIAGDACHNHPPYGGFGLNAGLEDIANLGWKLAAVLQGWGGERLLDSYTEERQPIFVETGEAMIAGWINKDRDFLNRYRPDRNRAEFEEAWKGAAKLAALQSSEPYYEGSSVILGPEGGKCTIHGEHTLAARAGHHLTPQVLSSGRNVFEELSPWFTLLAFGADETEVSAFEQTASALSVPLKVIRDSFEEGRQAYESRLVLVRPDQYIAWCGSDAPPDIAGVMRKVAGM